MKKIVITAVLSVVSSFVFAHGGRLDIYGCHYDYDHKSRYYHCH